MNDFHFLRPNLLLFFIPFFILSLILFRTKFKTQGWSQVCSRDLMPYVLNVKNKHSFLSYLWTFSFLILLIVALAGPAWQTISTPLIKSQSGLVIALDLSKTMDARDVKPSRLQRAVYKLNDILNARPEGYTALVVFSEDPFVVTPMTDDVSTIKAMIPALETNIMPTAGHNPYKAISKSIDLLHQAGISNGSILLITSELAKHEMEKSIEIANLHGIKVFALGVGTDQASPVQNQEGGFMKDEKGALLISMLSKENLKFLAKATQGAYATITPDDTDINHLVKKLNGLDYQESGTDTELTQSKWHDQGYLFVLAALPFASLIFRRGILILILFIFPYTLQALTWTDLWKTSDQQGEQLFHQEEFEEAKQKFQNPDWKAATHYKLGDFEAAADLYQTDESAEGLYNYGTSKAKQSDFKSALEAYGKALKINPEHEDTLYNKKLIEDLLKKEQNEQKSQENSDKQNQKNQNNNDKQNQKNEDNGSQNSEESSEQENSKDSEDSQGSQDQSEDKQKEPNNEQQKNQSNEKESPESEKPNENLDKKSSKSQEVDKQDQEKLQDQYRNQVDKEIEQQKGTKPLQPVQSEEPSPEEEQQQMDERWLQRIKDDPSALLRRKFLLQSREQK